MSGPKNTKQGMMRAEMREHISELRGQIANKNMAIARLERELAAATGVVRRSILSDEEATELPQVIDELTDLLPQETRDRNAAGAFVRYRGNAYRALVDLGYDIAPLDAGARADLARQVFGTEGVRRILANSASGLDAAKDSLIARQIEEALFGEAETSARAFGTLARIGGWIKPTQVDVRSRNLNLNMSSPEELLKALDAFDHEPGAPVKAGVLGATTGVALSGDSDGP